MNNFDSPGNVVTLTAPTGGVTSGLLYVVGGLPAVAVNDAAAAAEFEGQITGVVKLVKASGTAWTEGQAAYWDATNGRASVTQTDGPLIGCVADAAASAAVEAKVRLNGVSLAGGVVHNLRARLTIAEVNAGATILPAIAGLKYRMVNCAAVAVGGAVAAVTTVDVKGVSTSIRKLVAFAQASLTQSAVLRAGDSGAAVLADGASFTANDAASAITVDITGSDVTTATHIDFLFDYVLDT